MSRSYSTPSSRRIHPTSIRGVCAGRRDSIRSRSSTRARTRARPSSVCAATRGVWPPRGGNRHVEPAPVVVGGPLQQRLPQLGMLGHEPRLLLGGGAGLLLAPRVRGGLTERRLERLV